ncbi:class I SAM-dependent methyltransferase [Jiella endophytica]|uniref:Class I SAM-dependent methyltransferase n=1 Tax=Jiella endophytica TaxID=2558362 RepID=A0A4Y8RIK6_9HYPH|nr:class I SAM-dependent methyltransferase [Jiella endophytica]TFF21814.1 class I SAM-dependent methyltransferase [Jiella endophytica]
MTSCHACGAPTRPLDDVVFRDFDGSLFSRSGVIRHCTACGLGAVDTGLSDAAIARHYADDCLYVEMTGVGVGGNTPEDAARYEHYADILAPFVGEISAKAGLVDVGCSRGGMLRDLKDRFPELPLSGIDLDEASLASLRQAGIAASPGSALDLPLPTASQSMLSYLHVFEHILDTDQVLKEAARVIMPEGLLFIEVPDAADYGADDARVGTMFWLAMKEHVYHFTKDALAAILARNGFSVLRTVRSHLPMRAGKAYPSLIVVARKTEDASAAAVSGAFDKALPEHVAAEIRAFAEQAQAISAFCERHERIAFWGISLEFLNLWARLGNELKRRFPVRLFDGNGGKQKLTVDGLPIGPAGPPLSSEGLVVCAYMAGEAISQEAARLGWREETVLVLEGSAGARQLRAGDMRMSGEPGQPAIAHNAGSPGKHRRKWAIEPFVAVGPNRPEASDKASPPRAGTPRLAANHSAGPAPRTST